MQHISIKRTFLLLTVTAPWITNCRACRVLLANKARKTATSSRRSSGAKVICMKGVRLKGVVFSEGWGSRPWPRPADAADPSSRAKRAALMGTTLRMRRENIRAQWLSGICSPWYARAIVLAVHFCWKKVLATVLGLRCRARLYRLYLLHDCRSFCGGN